MKKMALIGILILAFSLISGSALAQSFCFPPYPVYGKVDFFGLPVGHIVLSVNSVVIEESDVNSVGEYSFDLGNMEGCYFTHIGQTGRISACNTEPTCNFDFIVGSTVQVKRNFKFVAVPPVEVPSDTSIISGGGGGGGGGGGNAPIWTCQEWTECLNGVQSQTCTESKYNYKSTEKRSCTIAPVVVPVIPTEPIVPIEPEPATVVTPVYNCPDGTQVTDLAKCPEKQVIPPEPESNLFDYLIYLIAGIIALFAWGKGFAGLIKYYMNKSKEAEQAGDKELAKKYRERAEKMAKSVITNYLAGKYKK